MASTRSHVLRPGASWLSPLTASKSVGLVYPQMRQPVSWSPQLIRFMTRYSSVSCVLIGDTFTLPCPGWARSGHVSLCVDCREFTRTTIWRMDELGEISDMGIARSDKIRIPVPKVLGRRSHFTSVHTVFSFAGRSLILSANVLYILSQQILRRLRRSPLEA